MSSEASSKVAAPAISLIAASSISLLYHVIIQCINIYLIASDTSMPELFGMTKGTQMMVRIGWSLVIMIISLIILIGAVKMLRLSNKRWAKTACILALIPCMGPCFILHPPLGIWGLIVLKQGEIASSFKQ